MFERVDVAGNAPDCDLFNITGLFVLGDFLRINQHPRRRAGAKQDDLKEYFMQFIIHTCPQMLKVFCVCLDIYISGSKRKGRSKIIPQ